MGIVGALQLTVAKDATRLQERVAMPPRPLQSNLLPPYPQRRAHPWQSRPPPPKCRRMLAVEIPTEQQTATAASALNGVTAARSEFVSPLCDNIGY